MTYDTAKRQEAGGIANWYYKQGAAELGSVSRERLAELAEAGFLHSETPVREETQFEWQPYGATGHVSDTVAPTPAPPDITRRCTRCENDFPPSALVTFRGEQLCAPCKADYVQHLVQGTVPDPHAVPYRFLKRAGGKLIDVNIPIMLYNLVFYLSETYGIVSPVIAVLTVPVGLLLYAGGMTYSMGRFGGTPGKLVFRLNVVDARGERVSYGPALVRTFAELFSLLTLGIGYLLVLADREGRTLHDHIAQTTVVQEGA